MPLKHCLWVLAVGVGVRLALALGTDVYSDEAYYWQWSRHLAWGYFDHAPAVAWLIAAFGVRPTALLCGLGTLAAVWALAREVYGTREAAWRAAALWSVVPVGVLGGVWATPDAPLLLFWVLALWALYRERWALAGVASGLALLSKYHGVLLALAFLATAARTRRLPVGAWGTALLGGLCFLPVVLWNHQWNWAGFEFQLNHGLGGTGGWASVGEFLGGQFALGGPVLLPLTLYYVARGPRAHFLLRAAAAVPLVGFGLAAWRTRGEANWPAVAYLTACVGVAGMGPGAWRAVAGSGLLIVVLGTSHLLWPVVHLPRDVPLMRTHGWAALATLAEPQRLFPQARREDVVAVYAGSYQLASQAAYYTGLRTDTAGVDRRTSQYDVWPKLRLAPGHEALWISENPEEAPPAELMLHFTEAEGPAELPGTWRGRRLRTFSVWWLRGARP